LIRPKKPPFAGSKVDAHKTKGQIDKMLREYGCDALQWTEEFDRNLIELRFLVEVEMQGQRRKLGVKLTPPLFLEKRRTWDAIKGKHVVEEAPNFSQSMRVLYWYLKSKLAAVAYGVKPFEEEFLAEIVVPTEQGERRLVDILKDKSPQMLGLPEKHPQPELIPYSQELKEYSEGQF
jgi:hypothetical protein